MFLINKPAYPGATELETLLPYFKGNKKRDLIRFDWPEYKPDHYTNTCLLYTSPSPRDRG